MRAQLLTTVIYSFMVLSLSARVNGLTPTSSEGIVTTPAPEQAPEMDAVRVECANDEMLVTIVPAAAPAPPPSQAARLGLLAEPGLFSGMVYPRGLTKNSSCLVEYVRMTGPLLYRLPLSYCNTMSNDTEDGGVEYFNTIVVQPHLKLVTSQGRGYQVKCRYETRERTPIVVAVNKTLVGQEQLTAALVDPASLPGVMMRIYTGDGSTKQVPENVKIGDPLSMFINLDEQEKYGITISDCMVRDGLKWGEQRLLDKSGCPLNHEIMGQFVYNKEMTKAHVSFPAHKFPYTSSVYYQCHVRLCNKAIGDCEVPNCNKTPNSARRRRQDSGDDGAPATIEVFSGLYVNEGADTSNLNNPDDVSRERSPDDPDSLCISQRTFALAVAIAGLVLMLLVLLAVLILCARRRRSHKDVSTSGSSLYSGPYTNTAYSHSS
ncbi:cuticlin-4 [Cloeon dipterum]|uniref:cuticlin-4 n=1 Tax=Cloeon dipterum TaxID=197152 RepID=UPI00321FEAA3